jgi:hypothetical protein
VYTDVLYVDVLSRRCLVKETFVYTDVLYGDVLYDNVMSRRCVLYTMCGTYLILFCDSAMLQSTQWKINAA